MDGKTCSNSTSPGTFCATNNNYNCLQDNGQFCKNKGNQSWCQISYDWDSCLTQDGIQCLLDSWCTLQNLYCPQNQVNQPQNQANQTSPQNQANLEPIIFIVADCVENSTSFLSPNGSQQLINRDYIVFLIIATDIIVVICYIFFIEILELQQQNYVQEYSNQTVEMNDFCVRIENISNFGFNQGSLSLYKVELWNQINQVLRGQHEIMDITFVTNEITQPKCLQKMFELQNQIKNCQIKIDSLNQENFQKKQLQSSLEKYKQEYESMRKQYYKSKDDQEFQLIYMNEILSDQKFERKQMEKQIQQHIPYISAFVVFRTIQGAHAFIQSYQIDSFFDQILKLFCKSYYMQIKMDMHKTMRIGGSWPELEKSANPQNINFEHLDCLKRERQIRIAIMWTIAFVFLILTFVGVVELQNYYKQAQYQFLNTDACSSSVSRLIAYNEQQFPVDEQQGLMGCLCYNQIVVNNQISFKDQTFQDINYFDTTLYCNIWYQNYLAVQNIQYYIPIFLVGINLVACICFEFLRSFEKQILERDQTFSNFQKLTVLQFCNIAVVLLFTSFNSQNRIQGTPLLQGDYYDITPQWVRKVVSAICFTIILNIGTPYVSKLLSMNFLEIYRLYDRRFKSQLNNNADGQQVNSRQLTHSRVIDIYTSPQIPLYFIYAQLITSILAIMTYSSGMPILYPIAFINLVFLYWVNKYLIVNHYSNSIKFDEQLPQYAIFYLKVSIVFHCVMTAFIFSSKILEINTPDFNAQIQNSSSQLVSPNVIKDWQRFGTSNGIIQVGFIIALAALFVLKDCIIKPLIIACSKNSNKRRKSSRVRSKEAINDAKHKSIDIFRELGIDFFEDYYEKFSNEKNDLIAQKDQYLLFQRNQEYERMEQIFSQRLSEFQDIIDFYFQILVKMFSLAKSFQNDLQNLSEGAKVKKLREYFQLEKKESSYELSELMKRFLSEKFDLGDTENLQFSDKIKKLAENKSVLLQQLNDEKMFRMKELKQTYEAFEYSQFLRIKQMLNSLKKKYFDDMKKVHQD